MSKIFKRNDINVDNDSKVVIKHKNLPEEVIKNYRSAREDGAEAISLEDVGARAEEMLATAKAKADHIVKTAKASADKIIDDATSKQSELYDIAKSNGYEDGYKEGYDEGVIIGENSVSELIEQKEQELEEINKEKENLYHDAENEIIDLVNDIVSKVMYGAFELNPQLLTVLVKRGMDNATVQNKVSIKVSDVDYNNVAEHIDEFKKLIDSSKEVEILKDFSLLKNDCLIETEFGNINCGLDEQLRSIKESLYFILNDK